MSHLDATAYREARQALQPGQKLHLVREGEPLTTTTDVTDFFEYVLMLGSLRITHKDLSDYSFKVEE
ncbi:MAG TPA: hypothetical protein VJ841_00900 [Candidatus Saccharimonadales bacterium]|nr:hypothetical protein [Candidatus Saccharimonadales bacterium]